MFYYLLIPNFRNGVILMTKIMFFGTRAYEKDMALRWGKKNNIDVTTSKELLSVDTVDQLKDYDGVTTMQFGKLESEVYPKLESYGIKQIAQRTAGFDMYDLELAKTWNYYLKYT